MAIVKNSLSEISTKLLDIFVHSQIASKVIIESLFTDLDFTCHSSEPLSLQIQKISFIYVQAVAVDQIVVILSDAV